MISYLEKFNNLPQEAKDKISSPDVMNVISELEKKYAISLASVVMRVMVKDIRLVSLSDFFTKEFSLNKRRADELSDSLKTRVFSQVAKYLGVVEDVKKQTNSKNKPPLPVSLNKDPKNQANTKTSQLSSAEQEGRELKNWMNDRKSDMTPRDSSFFFSPEDEEEVKMLAKKVAGFTTETVKQDEAKEGLKIVMKESGVNFSSDDMKKRFEQVIRTYLHGVRNRIDTKQTLIKSVEVGGLGIENKKADEILQLATKYRREPEQPTLKSGAKGKQSGAATPVSDVAPQQIIMTQGAASVAANTSGDVDYNFDALIDKEEKAETIKKKEEELAKKQKEEQEKKPPTPLKREKSTYEDKKEGEEEDEKEEFIDLTKLENLKDDRAIDIGKKMRSQGLAGGGNDSDINIVQARAAAANGKMRMEDVKHVPKLTGPIDELKEMNVVNFRRLSDNPREAALKVKKKIGFLEEESYTKRFEGIKAWRQSPVNKLYLEIGQESIINKSPVNAIIEKRRKEGKRVLTEHEFKAVMDLNKDLRF